MSEQEHRVRIKYLASRLGGYFGEGREYRMCAAWYVLTESGTTCKFIESWDGVLVTYNVNG